MDYKQKINLEMDVVYLKPNNPELIEKAVMKRLVTFYEEIKDIRNLYEMDTDLVLPVFIDVNKDIHVLIYCDQLPTNKNHNDFYFASGRKPLPKTSIAVATFNKWVTPVCFSFGEDYAAWPSIIEQMQPNLLGSKSGNIYSAQAVMKLYYGKDKMYTCDKNDDENYSYDGVMNFDMDYLRKHGFDIQICRGWNERYRILYSMIAEKILSLKSGSN